MGYFEVFSFILSLHNKSAEKAERRAEERKRESLAELQEIQMKNRRVEEKLQEIRDELGELYAKGKITERKFNKLKEREVDISLDLIVFGGGPGVSLSKQYITGKINKAEFESKKKAFIRSEVLAEKAQILEEGQKTLNAWNEFLKLLRKKKGHCSSCALSQSLFLWLKEVDGFPLCNRCEKGLTKIKTYPGFKGVYFQVSPTLLTKGEPLVLRLRQEHLSSIR